MGTELQPILKPIFFVETLGEHAVLPDGGIINAGGVSGSTFTVGGQQVLFAGSTSGGDITSFQTVYESGSSAEIDFISDRNLILQAINGNQLVFDANTGTLSLSGNLTVQGNIQGIIASEVISNTIGLAPLSGSNAQDVFQSIAAVMTTLSARTDVKAYEHVQLQPSSNWIISHNQNTHRIQVSIWDNFNELVLPDNITLTDGNNVQIEYNSPQSGRAILMLF